GHIFYQAFENIMPFERFYLGGAHSVRSYETDLCPPLGYFTGKDGVCCFVPQGGKTMFNCNLEVRFPLVHSLGAVLFQDFGALVGKSKKDFGFSNMLVATGFGLRYKTPIGPLRFDIGWKWNKHRPTDYSYAWFLSLGHAF
ncbi:BamA/TamA family outer membrane protein, partial [bacterium]|nr:BamA/TamA family outer membrane protein [bacterium]